MTYIATFFAHFGAVRFNRICSDKGLVSKMMPVPRSLSSSCGTCVKYESDSMLPEGAIRDEIEQIALVDGEEYRIVYTEDGEV